MSIGNDIAYRLALFTDSKAAAAKACRIICFKISAAEVKVTIRGIFISIKNGIIIFFYIWRKIRFDIYNAVLGFAVFCSR